ncbi:hypothetical protein [Dactylosporangium sp. NPDC048998]|uniref:hypothetical protein n=1 Tax=Dactylosporangium sp. NPDC048998 TaxID=3363976 RepID=UPI003721FB5C
MENPALDDLCSISAPETCLVPKPSPSPTKAFAVAAKLLLADPPAPCRIKVKQVVVVSEVFKADKKPKVGDTLEIQIDINATSAAKDSAKKAIDYLAGKGKTVASITVVGKVTGVDDLGALVVYCQVTTINAQAKGYGVSMGVTDGPKLALAVTVIEP